MSEEWYDRPENIWKFSFIGSLERNIYRSKEMAAIARFHLLHPSTLLKPSTTLSTFPHATPFFAISPSNSAHLRLHRRPDRKFSSIPPFRCNPEVSESVCVRVRVYVYTHKLFVPFGYPRSRYLKARICDCRAVVQVPNRAIR